MTQKDEQTKIYFSKKKKKTTTLQNFRRNSRNVYVKISIKRMSDDYLNLHNSNTINEPLNQIFQKLKNSKIQS